jgi:hypothetical protein
MRSPSAPPSDSVVAVQSVRTKNAPTVLQWDRDPSQKGRAGLDHAVLDPVKIDAAAFSGQADRIPCRAPINPLGTA